MSKLSFTFLLVVNYFADIVTIQSEDEWVLNSDCTIESFLRVFEIFTTYLAHWASTFDRTEHILQQIVVILLISPKRNSFFHFISCNVDPLLLYVFELDFFFFNHVQMACISLIMLVWQGCCSALFVLEGPFINWGRILSSLLWFSLKANFWSCFIYP